MSLSFRQGCEDHLRLCRFFSANAFFNMTFLSTLSFSLFLFLTYLLLVYTLLPLLRQECWFPFDTVAMTTYGFVVFSAQMLLSLDILTPIWPYLTDGPKFPQNAVDNLFTFWRHTLVGPKTTQGHGSPSPLLCKPARWGSPPTFRSFTLLDCWSFCLLCYINFNISTFWLCRHASLSPHKALLIYVWTSLFWKQQWRVYEHTTLFPK